MTALTYVTEISVNQLLKLNPATELINLGVQAGSGQTLGQLTPVAFSLGTKIGNSFANSFTNAWDFFLNNFITPFTVIALIFLFFALQYYLLRLYYLIFKYFIGRAMVLYSYIIKTSWFLEFKRKYDVVFSE